MVGKKAKEVDVCLILEGTYPYVRGGVSTWVHQIITALPELSFSVFYIGWEKEPGVRYQYDPLPENLLEVKEAYLCDYGAGRGKSFSNKKYNEALDQLDQLSNGGLVESGEITKLLQSLAEVAEGRTFESAWGSERAWASLMDFYDRRFDGHSFVDFFWAVKNMAHPFWSALKCVLEVPKARVIHSVCTGYAGMIGALAANRQSRPFLLSEHGVYVRERVKDLLKREWTPKGQTLHLYPTDPGISPLTRLWMEFFLVTGRIAYDSAGQIVSLFQKNKDIQVSFGAKEERIQIIPNGISLEMFQGPLNRRRERRWSNREKVVVGFLGRIVAIKDVRMLIRAAAQVCRECREVEFLLVGPKDEDIEYAAGCDALIVELGIGAQVKMPGGVSNPHEILQEFDIMVLSSVSEGLPFAIIEAFAMEMPVVSTDVGACHELVFGRNDEATEIGPAGEIVPVGDSSALANSLIKLIKDWNLQDQLGRAGRKRVEAHYLESDVVSAYKTLYTQNYC